MAAETESKLPGLWIPLFNAFVLVALVAASAFLTGFDRDPWRIGSAFALSLSTSLIVGFWLQGHCPSAIWLGTFIAFAVLSILMGVVARVRAQTPTARIAFPNSSVSVSQFTPVAGVYENLEDGSKLWVCLHTPGDNKHKYYCSNASAYSDGRWESADSKGFQIGTPTADNETLPYTLSVWLSDHPLAVGGEAFDSEPRAKKMDSVIVRRRQ